MHRKQKTLKILLASCLLFFVSACSALNTRIAVPTDHVPSITSTLTSTITIIPTAQPTKRSTPTSTPPQISLVDTATAIPTPDIRATAFQQAADYRATLTARFSITCTSNNDIEHHSYLSPDGKWLAISCSERSIQTLEIVSENGNRWLLHYEDFVPDEYKAGHGTLYPEYWVYGDYLFFTSNPHISVGGPCLYPRTYSLGLYRINLITGLVSTPLPPMTIPSYSFAFSPNGRWLAYIGERGRIGIFDVKDGEEELIEIKDDTVGNLTWSPDSSMLAYASCQTNQDTSELAKSYINIYSMDTHASKRIVEETGILLVMDDYDSNPLLKISEGYDNGSTVLWLYDWFSDQLISADPTPTAFHGEF